MTHHKAKMIIKQAKAIARQWVEEEATQLDGFYGAFYHGSINWLSDEESLSATSDVDIMVLFIEPPSIKLGKFIYQGIMLEVSYLSYDEVQSAELILGQSHLAGSFKGASIIADPTGQLSKVQAVVARNYAKREWVYRRCEYSRDKVLHNLQGLTEAIPFHDQVMTWLFATGVTTHILLVAGLKNPTVRKRYLAVRELLADYDQLAFYESLLALLDCNQMNRTRVEGHLDALEELFDLTKTVLKTPIFFASDLSDIARPLAIDGSRELIERGYHREAIFWIVATYSRCQKVLYQDGTVEMQERFRPAYRQLLQELGIESFADMQRRGEAVKALLPRIWDVRGEIMAMNSEIEG